MKLSTVKELEKAIKSARRRLEFLRAEASSIKSPPMDGLPRSTGQASRVEVFAALIADEERRLAELYNEFDDKRIQLMTDIYRRVEGKAGEVLILRYVECLPHSEIAARLGYSLPNIFHLHRRGKRAYEGVDGD